MPNSLSSDRLRNLRLRSVRPAVLPEWLRLLPRLSVCGTNGRMRLSPDGMFVLCQLSLSYRQAAYRQAD